VNADSGDVTGHVEDKAAAVVADDDDVDELSSSDVSSDVRHNNLTSSTDDNTASCRSPARMRTHTQSRGVEDKM